ncbi:hypothetical protein B7P43_G11700 [Cryptotermes secundus]|uniref:RING-type E3 ubiquitin transferase n=1 Tax=Cryptotermes secundus TaxID=105785 RepID=A0A2J7PX16_9NEOP|nr:hypothetical protein B7P43_G11700 [Cryptotermes secundus]
MCALEELLYLNTYTKFFYVAGIKCPVCAKFVLPDDIECHLVMCLTKPRLSYNEDVLTDDKGECVICLEDLQQGDTIARLPCLCIYHKRSVYVMLLILRLFDDGSIAETK